MTVSKNLFVLNEKPHDGFLHAMVITRDLRAQLFIHAGMVQRHFVTNFF